MTCAEFIQRLIRDGVLTANRRGEVFSRGKRVGTISARGYLVASIRGYGLRKQIKLHQVVWRACQRRIPPGRILDHKNRIKTDNRLTNLRTVTHADNAKNRRSYRGMRNPSAVVDHAAVMKLRRRGLSYREIAEKLNVSASAVANHVRRGEI